MRVDEFQMSFKLFNMSICERQAKLGVKLVKYLWNVRKPAIQLAVQLSRAKGPLCLPHVFCKACSIYSFAAVQRFRIASMVVG